MKVLLFIPAFLNGRGGAEKVAGKVASLLSRNKISTSIACAPAVSNSETYQLDKKVTVIEIVRRNEYDWIKLRGKFDLLIGFAMSGLYGDIVQKAAVLDCPYVIQECSNPHRMLGLMVANQQDKISNAREAFWLRQSILSSASAVRLTVPDYEDSVLDEIKPFTYAFYNSLEQPKGRQKPLAKRPKKIVAIGALKTSNKNGISGARSFLKSGVHKDGWSLHFYGKNSFEDEFLSLREQPGGDCIFDHGISTDPNEMYADANLLLIPSFEEGLPNVVVEAFSYGVPAIGYQDCPGTNHLIKPGERGTLVADFNEDLMAKEIQTLCNNESKRVKMGSNAKSFAKNNFTNAQFEKNWLEMVKNAVSGKNKYGQIAPFPIETYKSAEVRKALANILAYHKVIPSTELDEYN